MDTRNVAALYPARPLDRTQPDQVAAMTAAILDPPAEALSNLLAGLWDRVVTPEARQHLKPLIETFAAAADQAVRRAMK